MNISSTHKGSPLSHPHGAKRSAPSDQVQQDEPQEPQDLYDFKTNATMVGGFSLMGGVAGAIPGLGALSYAPASNHHGANTLTKAAALGGFVANLVSTAVVLNGGPAWSMAVPGALGAVTWGSFAYATRNHC